MPTTSQLLLLLVLALLLMLILPKGRAFATSLADRIRKRFQPAQTRNIVVGPTGETTPIPDARTEERRSLRARIAQINACRVCQSFRAARDVVDRFDVDSVPEELYEHVGDPSWPGFTERELLAMEFTERFALDHLSMERDADFWKRLHEHFTDDELVDLACCAGAHLVNGRINRVFDVEGDCSIRPVVRFPDPAAVSAGGSG